MFPVEVQSPTRNRQVVSVLNIDRTAVDGATIMVRLEKPLSRLTDGDAATWMPSLGGRALTDNSSIFAELKRHNV
jgi:hypothetical protein